MSPKLRLAVLLALTLVGAALAASLLLQHHGEPLGTAAVAQLCGSGDSGCDKVNQSPYAEVAGIPWAAVGLVFYLSMAALVLLALAGGDELRGPVAGALFVFFGLGLLVDLGLFVLQAVYIKAFCKLCLATYAVNAAAVALLWPSRRSAVQAPAALMQPSGRLAGAGWIVATLAFALGIFGLETVLAHREAQRAKNILGIMPPSAPAPAPAVSAEPATAAPPADAPADVTRYQEELKAAQAEVARLNGILDDPQKYEKYQADKSLRDFSQGPTHDIALKETPFKGPADAKIKVVEYSDFLCPFCRQIAQAFNHYVNQSANRVAVYYKFYPLDATCNPELGIHPGACWLAYGAVCAHQQGKFWPYHDKVFSLEHQHPHVTPDRAFVAKLGAELGLDASAFDTCLASPKTKDRVAADIQEGKKVGVKGTPTIFINGRRLPRSSEFLQAVDHESKRLGLGPMPAVQ